MPDRFESEVNYPPHQKESPQPKYKTLSFESCIEDDLEDWCSYRFSANYYEHDNKIRIVEAQLDSVKTGEDFPIITNENDWYWTVIIAMSEELRIGYDSIIFECKIELK